jgi:arabinofuranosyltransferase
VLLMLLYVVWVSGDFMSGRLLTAPFLVGVGLLISRRMRPELALAIAGGLFILLLTPLMSPFRDRYHGPEWHSAIDQHGTADERLFYRSTTSLRRYWDQRRRGRTKPWPNPLAVDKSEHLRRDWPEDSFLEPLNRWGVLRPQEEWPPRILQDEHGGPHRKVVIRGAVGILGYYLGPDMHVLDYYAICDPLLSRLPVDVPDPVLQGMIPRLGGLGWRVGHYYRRPPLGYVRTLASGRNQIHNPALAAYYDVIRSIIRDPVFDLERLATVWRYNLGAYDELLVQAKATGY